MSANTTSNSASNTPAEEPRAICPPARRTTFRSSHIIPVEVYQAFSELDEKDKEIAVLKERIEGIKTLLDDKSKSFESQIKQSREYQTILAEMNKEIASLRKLVNDLVMELKRPHEGNMAGHRQGYISIVATAVIDVAKAIFGRLAGRKRPSSAKILPPARRLQLGDCDIVTSPMTDDEDYDDVFYDAVSTNDNTTPSTAPSTALVKR